MGFTKHSKSKKCFTEIISHIINELNHGPVFFAYKGPNGYHAIVILGYKGYDKIINKSQEAVGNYDNLVFIAHDPLAGAYVEYSFSYLSDYLKYGSMYSRSFLYEAENKLSIHMPDYTPGPDAFHIGGASGIVLKKDGSIIDYIWWDHLSYGGYKFFNSTYGQNTGHTNPINVSSFDTVEFKGIPVYNTEKTNTQYNPSLKLRTRILRNGNEIYSNDSAGLIKSGFNYPVDTYSIDWKTLKTSLVTSVQNGDVFRVYVCLIEQNSNGGLMTETLHGEFNFSFTAL